MDQFVGLDVSQDLTHICVLSNDARILWQGKCHSTPDAIAQTVRAKAPQALRIGLETGPLSTWHYHALKEMALPIVCIDARHAQAALSMQLNKTDKNDAQGLAELMRMGWYREVGVKTLDSHTVRSMLGARFQLVGMRTNIINQMRGILKTFGHVLKPTTGKALEDAILRICSDGDGMLNDTLASLLSVYQGLKSQIAVLDRQLLRYARTNIACDLMMTIPGVGPLTAAAFVSAIDDPAKFSQSSSVGAYLGLTPRRYQSGQIDRIGKISKCGDPLVRAYLFEAATTLLTRVHKWSSLKAWGLRLAKRSGMKKAKIAVARKLAVMMHRMWLTGECFRWSEPEISEAVT